MPWYDDKTSRIYPCYLFKRFGRIDIPMRSRGVLGERVRLLEITIRNDVQSIYISACACIVYTTRFNEH